MGTGFGRSHRALGVMASRHFCPTDSEEFAKLWNGSLRLCLRTMYVMPRGQAPTGAQAAQLAGGAWRHLRVGARARHAPGSAAENRSVIKFQAQLRTDARAGAMPDRWMAGREVGHFDSGGYALRACRGPRSSIPVRASSAPCAILAAGPVSGCEDQHRGLARRWR
jgi:hypothetical protein